jgi:hypothetical protein
MAWPDTRLADEEKEVLCWLLLLLLNNYIWPWVSALATSELVPSGAEEEEEKAFFLV